jgi:hypothetical protein
VFEVPFFVAQFLQAVIFLHALIFYNEKPVLGDSFEVVHGNNPFNQAFQEYFFVNAVGFDGLRNVLSVVTKMVNGNITGEKGLFFPFRGASEHAYLGAFYFSVIGNVAPQRISRVGDDETFLVVGLGKRTE